MRTLVPLLVAGSLAVAACEATPAADPTATTDAAPAATDATTAATDATTAADDTSSAPTDATTAPDASDVEAPAPLCSTTGAGTPWAAATLAGDGPYLAGYVDLTVTDPDRATAAHGIFPEAQGRTLAIRVWYPATRPFGDLTPALLAPLARDDGPFPLLVHSHGFSSNKDELTYAAQWLATRGWVVAALEFPLTNLTTSGGPQLLDVVNQPADVAFALDQLLARSGNASDPLYQAIDADRIALSGVSLGGLTTLLATYHRDLHDARVRAAVDIAGPTGFLAPAFYGFVPLPILLVYGDTDAIVDYAAHALPARSRAPSGTRLLTLAHASHTGFAAAASLFEDMDNPDSIGCSAIEGQLPDSSSFLDELSDPVVGITPVELPAPCSLDPLPTAMRPSRQQLLTRLALYGWLELQLGATAAERATACAFLLGPLAAEPDLTLE